MRKTADKNRAFSFIGVENYYNRVFELHKAHEAVIKVVWTR